MTLDELITFCKLQGWSVHYPTGHAICLRLFNHSHQDILDGEYPRGCMIEVYNGKPDVHFYTCDRILGTDALIRERYLTDEMIDTFVSYN